MTHSFIYVLILLTVGLSKARVPGPSDPVDSNFASTVSNYATTTEESSFVRCQRQETMDTITNATTELLSCLDERFNATEIITRFQKAIANKTTKPILTYYCQQIDVITECYLVYQKLREPCLDRRMKEELNISLRSIRAAFNFVCYRDGERILLFLKDKGIDCVTDRGIQAKVLECVQNTFPQEVLNTTDLQHTDLINAVEYSESRCPMIKELDRCIYWALRGCSNRTPADLIEALMKSMMKVTPCWKSKTSRAASGPLLSAASPFVFVIFYLLGHRI